MKVIVVHDLNGTILAAVAHTGSYDGPLPLPSIQSRLLEVDLPQSDADLPLDAICRRFRVDIESKRLVERPSSSR